MPLFRNSLDEGQGTDTWGSNRPREAYLGAYLGAAYLEVVFLGVVFLEVAPPG